MITIVYPTDPLGVVPGGTDTCIRDILRCAPKDLEMQIVGVSTDSKARPIGRWTECEVSGRKFKFYPVLAVDDLEKQMKIPLSLQFTLRLITYRRVFHNSTVIQLNRIEPFLALLNIRAPKLLIIHQNMNVLKSKSSDIRWKYLPGLYFKFEGFVIRRMREVFIVREDAVHEYRHRFPKQKDSIHFLPTWMNPALFFYVSEQEKKLKREELPAIKVGENEQLIIFVGRLDHQKDPLYLIDILTSLKSKRRGWKMLVIGDGVLRKQVETSIKDNDLEGDVFLLGAVSQDRVAEYLRLSDLLLLSSAYEGMPRCVVEALGCGVPVVTTNAGEVTRLIKQGENGYIVEEKDPDRFSDYIISTLDNIASFRGRPCLDAVEAFRADKVLETLYETYRELGERK